MKKPQSAYFIFTGEKRQEIKDELLKVKETVSVGEVAKAIGSAWKALSDDERQKYQDMAAAQKAAYKKALEERGDAAEVDGVDGADGGDGVGGDAPGVSGTGKARVHSALPLSIVKKLATLDDEVKRISGDAVKVITEATGLFLGSLASKSMVVALENKRKNFKFEDIVKVAKRDPRLVDMGLAKVFEEQEPFSGWGAGGQGSSGGNLQRKRTAEGAGDAGEKKKAVGSNGGIAAFLTKKKDAADAVDVVDVVDVEEE